MHIDRTAKFQFLRSEMGAKVVFCTTNDTQLTLTLPNVTGHAQRVLKFAAFFLVFSYPELLKFLPLIQENFDD